MRGRLLSVLLLCILLSGCSTISCKVLSLDNICSWGAIDES